MDKPRPIGMVQAFFYVLMLAFWVIPEAMSAKVTLSADHWGKQEGEACINCHRKASAGLAREWEHSAHADAGVNCFDCHQAEASEDDAIEHEGSIISTIVSPLDCGRCHETEYQQQKGSVHANALILLEKDLPAGGGAHPLSGTSGCVQCHGSRVSIRGDGSLNPATWPNTGIGRINPDGSKGTCSACHGRHRFSKAQARDPEACAKCHSGTDSPDREVYAASRHGTLFSAYRDEMNLNSDSWIPGKDYTASATCVTCHMGAAGKIKPTHNVGMRDAWRLNGPISEKQYLVILED